jgi:hypothetical protein
MPAAPETEVAPGAAPAPGPDGAGRSRRAPRRRLAWPLGVAALLLGALALRVWGVRTGLPFVFNADENAHFVTRAIGMFGHSYNPGYFINPPGFSYALHGLFALRWGGDGVQAQLAADPTPVYALARVAAGVLGTLAVAALLWAGVRLFDRRTAFVAALLAAVAFLPVHYAHFALNDVPALAPLCVALVGVAGVLRRGRLVDFALAGAALGVACAVKYTAGIVLFALAAAVLLAPVPGRRRAAGAGLAAAAALAGFLVANPYALLDFDAFWDGLADQSSASNDGAGKLGVAETSGWRYYLQTLTWGLGWAALAAAAAGAAVLTLRDRHAALCLVPAPLVLLAFMGAQDRFFARWLLPAYPFLCLLAAVGALALADALARGRRRARIAAAVAAVAILIAQPLVLSVHNDAVLARADTRNLARAWLVEHVPEGAKVVVEPVFPDQWAMDPGSPSRVTGNGNRWNKWPTSRSQVNNDGTIRRGRGRVVKLEDYERTTRPQLVGSYERGGYCWVVTGSTQFGRALAEPAEVPNAIRYYDELRRRGEVVARFSPYDAGAGPVDFSFDDSFNARPLAYARPGPEIVVYKLRDCPR